ncbi:MAG TPA: helix-turn-helix domain-containing protein [Rubrivivax sp.]|nr:helix-turn-helix domain-containing protein [Rubrivivax sp.]
MRTYKIKTIRALDRGLEVLGVLQSTRGASLHELHLATALPKATLIRIIATLEGRGLIWQRLADGAYLPTHTLLPRAPQINDENRLVEAASPVLERLSRKVAWPSILSAPRLAWMEVIETNRPKSYFAYISHSHVGFRINMLRSASGRAYLAWCGEEELQAVLQRLRAGGDPGDFLAHRPATVARLLEETRQLGYGMRHAGFGGHFQLSRSQFDDERDSVAVPVMVGSDVIAAVNLTFLHKIMSPKEFVAAHLVTLRDAASEISRRVQRA